jgi:hypothetical protein
MNLSCTSIAVCTGDLQLVLLLISRVAEWLLVPKIYKRATPNSTLHELSGNAFATGNIIMQLCRIHQRSTLFTWLRPTFIKLKVAFALCRPIYWHFHDAEWCMHSPVYSGCWFTSRTLVALGKCGLHSGLTVSAGCAQIGQEVHCHCHKLNNRNKAKPRNPLGPDLHIHAKHTTKALALHFIMLVH